MESSEVGGQVIGAGVDILKTAGVEGIRLGYRAGTEIASLFFKGFVIRFAGGLAHELAAAVYNQIRHGKVSIKQLESLSHGNRTCINFTAGQEEIKGRFLSFLTKLKIKYSLVEYEGTSYVMLDSRQIQIAAPYLKQLGWDNTLTQTAGEECTKTIDTLKNELAAANVDINYITLDRTSLNIEEKDGMLITRVPKTYGDNIRFLAINPAEAVDINDNVTVFTYLDSKRTYTLLDGNRKAVEEITGANLIKNYDNREDLIGSVYEAQLLHKAVEYYVPAVNSKETIPAKDFDAKEYFDKRGEALKNRETPLTGVRQSEKLLSASEKNKADEGRESVKVKLEEAAVKIKEEKQLRLKEKAMQLPDSAEKIVTKVRGKE